ncbi:MAG: outer membrane beta-barrel protein [Planctomycetes bacterium]|nr:outer membrane beta-barrel protein [Planctomycetota bacterium]
MNARIGAKEQGRRASGRVAVLGAFGLMAAVLLAMGTTFSLPATAQPAPRRFTPQSTATQRFKNWRGAERLPKVDLSKEPKTGEGTYPQTELADFVRVRGGVGYQMEFSDNIFLVRGGEIPGRHKRPGDVFHVISPNVHMEVPGILAPIIVDYNADITRAGSFHEFDADEHYLSGIMDVKVGHGFGFRVRDSLSHEMSPPTFPSRRSMWVDPATGGVREYNPATETRHLLNYFWTNTAEIVGYYKSRNKLRIEGRFVHDLARFDARRNWEANYDIVTVGGELSYKILPRVSLVSEYYHDWDPSRRREHDHLAGGFEWDISAKLNGRVLAGYEWYHLLDGHNVGGWVGHAELTYDITSKLRFGFYGDHSIVETTTLEGGVSKANFESTSLSLDALYRFTRKLDFLAGIAYILDDIGEPPGATNELWVASAGIRWRPREQWSFEGRYQYQKYGPYAREGCFEENLFTLNAIYGF